MKKNIKAFTLIELLISIVLFVMIIGFFYSSLDNTKYSNMFLQNKLTKIEKNTLYKEILMEDILEASNVEIKNDTDKNSILYLTTTNSYHNVNYTKVIYLISEYENFVRIESLKPIKENSFNNLQYSKDYFIDIISTGIEKFKVTKSKDNTRHYLIILKKKEQEESFFNVKTFRD